MELVGMINPTSKAALKSQSLVLSNMDVEKAERMYDFLVKDMKELPDVDPIPKSFMQNVGIQANGVVSWLKENKDFVKEGVDFVRGIIASRNGGEAAAAAESLPIINP